MALEEEVGKADVGGMCSSYRKEKSSGENWQIDNRTEREWRVSRMPVLEEVENKLLGTHNRR